ncbi:MAG: (5-formylfuran-3-yl)methyl phosphate synthase [Candidatus Nanohaloarchaea archaeon]
MKALVTVVEPEEVDVVVEASPDIVDIKNPEEGSLGAPTPNVLENILDMLPPGTETSVAVGDVPDLPGTVAMAVRGASEYDVDYIKVGLKGPETEEEAFDIVEGAVEAAGEEQSVVVAGYADHQKAGAVELEKIPRGRCLTLKAGGRHDSDRYRGVRFNYMAVE